MRSLVKQKEVTVERVIPYQSSLFKSITRNWELYLILAPVIIYFAVFNYWPMYGVQIAFKDFMASKGIWGSPWVGFSHFERFFRSYYFMRLIKNTVGISIYSLAVGFPLPIILALMMNEMNNRFLKKTVQTVTYAPHFLSIVVLTGMVMAFLDVKNGIINQVVQLVGLQPVRFMTEPAWFKSIYVWSGVWQNTGWSSIIYMAALAGVDVELYEAALVDGASKLQRLRYITIPGIMPTAVIILILDFGRIMSVGFEKVFLLQNSLNMQASDVISTYVYRSGILGGEYSFSAAIGLFNSIINFSMLLIVNKISKKVTETSLW